MLSAMSDAGLGLEALHDGVGQHVAQHRVGLGLGALDEAERVPYGRRDQHERGDGALQVERVRHGLLAWAHTARGREPKPNAQMQYEAERHDECDQPDALQVEDHERTLPRR